MHSIHVILLLLSKIAYTKFSEGPYATYAYIAGLYDAFRIMTVLFPDKWDTDDIRELLAAKVNN